jgi:integrase
VRVGKDPAGEKQRARETSTETFKTVALRFLAFQKVHGGPKGLGLRPTSYRGSERHLMIYARPLHGLLLANIQMEDVAGVLSVMRGKGNAVSANRVRSSLSTFFGWAISEGLIRSNPVTGTKPTKEKSRERVLSHEELRLIWNNLDDSQFGDLIRLLALTGQRAAEIGGLRWSELTDYGFTLPSERTKNARIHTVPLSDRARDILAAQPRRQGPDGKLRDLIFGYSDGPFAGWAKAQDALNQRIERATGKALPHWVPHDVRRSFATHASDLGIQPHIIEAILNHTSGFRAGVAGIYNRNPYDAEKARALTLWADHLMAIVEGREGNVVPMRWPA